MNGNKDYLPRSYPPVSILTRTVSIVGISVIALVSVGAATPVEAKVDNGIHYNAAVYTTDQLVADGTALISEKINEINEKITVANMGKSGTTPTPALVALEGEANKLISESAYHNVVDLMTLDLFGSNMDVNDRVEAEEVANTAVAEHVSKLNDALVAWETEVVAENARIQAAEEEAARQAAAAAAAAANNSGGGGGNYSGGGGGGGGEDLRSRIQRIMNSMPFNYGFNIGACHVSNALGCYLTDGSGITFTSLLDSYGDCMVRVTIAHEWRHSWQDSQGLITAENYESGWLEADAGAFGYQYGC